MSYPSSRMSAFKAYSSSSKTQYRSGSSSKRSDRSRFSRDEKYSDDEEDYRKGMKSLMSIRTAPLESHKRIVKVQHKTPSLMDLDLGDRSFLSEHTSSLGKKRYKEKGDHSSFVRSSKSHNRNRQKKTQHSNSDSDEGRKDKHYSGRSAHRNRKELSSESSPVVVDLYRRDGERKRTSGGKEQAARERLKLKAKDRARNIENNEYSESDSDDQGRPVVKKQKRSGSHHRKHPSQTTASANRLTVYNGSKLTVVAIPTCSPCLAVHGKVMVTSVLGSVSVLGYTLDKGKPYNIYSPHTGALLTLSILEEVKFSSLEVLEQLEKFDLQDSDLMLDGLTSRSGAIVVLEKMAASPCCDYVTTFTPYTQLFNPVAPREEGQPQQGQLLTKLGVKIAPPFEMSLNCLNMTPEYQDVLNKWTSKLSSNRDKAPIVLCCGAKNCGKSTLNRMFINASLQRVDAVAYLEMDIGQTEFSPPATLSLHIIKDPVLGPPFCHQRHAERLVFYGDVTPTTEPSLYLHCLRSLVEAYHKEYSSLPLVVNSMGFTEGLGLMLLVDSIRQVQPDLVVQIDSYNQAVNLPAVTQEMVAMQPGWGQHYDTSHDDPKQRVRDTHPHELSLLMTLTSNRRDVSQKMRPVDLRHLSLLASLSLGLEPGMTLTSCPPYLVPWARLAIHVCHHPAVTGQELLAAVDTCVVALCVADLSQCTRQAEDSPYTFKEMPVCECLGLGIVRGIDRQQGLLYIVTTLPKARLKRMNTLLKGSLSLPDQLILKQKSSGPLPYMDALVPSTAVTSVRPRSRLPRSTLGGNFFN